MSRVREITPEFEERWNRAIANYLADPSPDNAVEAREAAFEFFRLRPERPSYGPFLGIMDAVEEKNPKVYGRWRHMLMLWAVRRILMPAKRPGWNDYWMCRWQMTHSRAAVLEIHRRTHHLYSSPGWTRAELEPVISSAHWMVGSYRRQDPAFDAAISEVEATCPDCLEAARVATDGGPCL